MTGGWDWSCLAAWASDLGIDLQSRQVEAFAHWADHMERWSRRLNLTSISEPRDVARLHFIDSLALWLVDEVRELSPVLDVGSGAGLPGLALKIVRPGATVDLLEASGKKVRYLERLTRDLRQDGVRVIHGRAEHLARAPGMRDSYPLAVARAVAPLPVLLEYCLPFCRPGGVFVAMKGPRAAEEIEQSGRALDVLGGTLARSVDVALPGGDERRTLLVFRKSGPTPDAYPRAAGRPARNPL